MTTETIVLTRESVFSCYWQDSEGNSYRYYTRGERIDEKDASDFPDECPSCGEDISGEDELGCSHCGMSADDMWDWIIREHCAICHTPILDGWYDCENGEWICDDHMQEGE